MARLILQHGRDQFGSMPLAIGLFISVVALVALCAKHSRRAQKDYENKEDNATLTPLMSPKNKKLVTTSISNKENLFMSDATNSPKSPFVSMSPRKLVTTISNKANTFMHKKKGGDEFGAEVDQRGFGEGGLWQKAILLGDKCRPPEFSGVIHYDSFGNKLSELPPRSPRASPLPSFLFPEAKDAN